MTSLLFFDGAVGVNVWTIYGEFIRCQECDAVHKLSLKSKKLKLIDKVDDKDQEEAE